MNNDETKNSSRLELLRDKLMSFWSKKDEPDASNTTGNGEREEHGKQDELEANNEVEASVSVDVEEPEVADVSCNLGEINLVNFEENSISNDDDIDEYFEEMLQSLDYGNEQVGSDIESNTAPSTMHASRRFNPYHLDTFKYLLDNSSPLMGYTRSALNEQDNGEFDEVIRAFNEISQETKTQLQNINETIDNLLLPQDINVRIETIKSELMEQYNYSNGIPGNNFLALTYDRLVNTKFTGGYFNYIKDYKGEISHIIRRPFGSLNKEESDVLVEFISEWDGEEMVQMCLNRILVGRNITNLEYSRVMEQIVYHIKKKAVTHV